MTKAKLTRIPKRVLACVLAVLMVLSCLTMLPFTGFAATPNPDLESPDVVADGSNYYAFGNNGVWYQSNDMVNWGSPRETYGYLGQDAMTSINDAYGHLGTVAKTDLQSPEVVEINNVWYMYLSIMKGNTSMIVRAKSDDPDNPAGPYTKFDAVLETGFARNDATDVLQGYFNDSYPNQNAKPQAVADWGRGPCYYYSNFLGLNYQWFTEQLPRAYAPSITFDGTDYWMAYGYRNGGIWLQKINAETGLIDFAWSGDNWNTACGSHSSAEDNRNSDYHYLPEDHYDTAEVDTHRFDPYFGQLIAHTTEGGDTDTTASSVTRAGEEPELYAVGNTLYLQVTYGGSDNSDGYNVRSYVRGDDTIVSGIGMVNFVDMYDNAAVDNARVDMIDGQTADGEDVTTTGQKLMGDYNIPGTDTNYYYTSPGASSVTAGENGMLFYSYQVKQNHAADGRPYEETAKLHSHILLNNRNGDPLVTPFEYTGSADDSLYEAAFGSSTYPVDNDTPGEQVAGQYYVTMSGTDTSTSKSSLGGITLTDGHLVSGAISGSWDFETIRVNGKDYVNGLVITDAKGHEYHGALLRQTVEDDTTLDGIKTTMTFTLAYGNQTIWGVWYDDYQPSSENNADAGLEVSSAIYTGGAIALNAQVNGQLGLKYGNYITAFKFAGIDYSTYLMIDNAYTIDKVVDYAHQGDDGIHVWPVAPGGSKYADYKDIIDAVFVNRTSIDAAEANNASDGNADPQNGDYTYDGDPNTSDSVTQLVEMLSTKANEAQQQGKNLYILTGYLNSGDFGRNAYMEPNRDKGSITLYVTYHDRATNADYSERVYSHVYQQPIPANLTASVYDSYWWAFKTSRLDNSVFLRAEGSYATDSYYPGGTTIRNNTIQTATDKKFSAKGIYRFYNPTLEYGTNEKVFTKKDLEYFHGETTSFLKDGDDIAMNSDQYRNRGINADVTSSYEMSIDDNYSDGRIYQIAGPRAEYYIDLSSPSTSSIADYISGNSLNIPLYYSSVPVNSLSNHETSRKNFDYGIDDGEGNEKRYRAGLYSYAQYWEQGTSNPLGYETLFGTATDYPFTANFVDVHTMYESSDPRGMENSSSTSAGANVMISADLGKVTNTPSTYNNEDTDPSDYTFYVRSKVENVDPIPHQTNHHLRMATDMEYGIYVSDKSYVRNFYNSIVDGKTAGGYTYYSWETFRDAIALVADYLNNYMELADAKGDPYDNTYDPNGEYESGRATVYENYITTDMQTTVDNVLESEDLLSQLLTHFYTEVQDVLCFLLNDAAERLFEYNYYGDFMAAYEEYTMLNNFEEYTSSSWKAYLGIKDETIMVNGQAVGDLTFEDLAGYAYAAQDNPEITPEDPAQSNGIIYDPFNPDAETVQNDSWKIINDYFFSTYNVTAKQVFLAATEQINKAIEVLRNKADYDALDSAYADAEQYDGDVDIASGHNEGNIDDAGITGVTGYDIFSIDRSTVAALANSMDQGTDVPKDDGTEDTWNYVADDEGNQYTISSMAAFDKIYSSIWELRPEENPSGVAQEIYADLVSDKGVVSTTCNPAGEEGQQNSEYYYSDQVRDDQQRYADTDGKQSTNLSTVQTKINNKADLLQTALGWLYSNQITDEGKATYETFDYLIDVISSIDFNAYTEDGQVLLWNTLEDMLVKGEVYSVNQQLFAQAPEGTDDAMADLLYGDEGYYTGLNTTNVDGYTTELMELLTTLNNEYRETYKVTFIVHWTDAGNTSSTTETVTLNNDGVYSYGDSAELKVPNYDSTKMRVDNWKVSMTSQDGHETTQVLPNSGGSLTYTGNNDAQVDVYVTRGLSQGATVPVLISEAFSNNSAYAVDLSDGVLDDYTVRVDGDTVKIVGPDESSIGEATAMKVPFYEFTGWKTVTGKDVNGLTLKQLYDLLYEKYGEITIKPTYRINGYDATIIINGNKKETSFNRTVTISTETYGKSELPGTFYAWLVLEGGEYKVASYNANYVFDAIHGDQTYVQVNVNDGVYYVWSDEDTDGFVEYDSKSQYDKPEENLGLNTDSLYYRLSHKLRDSWSTISNFDDESRKVVLYSHFTDGEGKNAARVVENGVLYCLAKNDSDDETQRLDNVLVLDQYGNVPQAGIYKLISASDANNVSEGEYAIGVHFAESQNYSQYALAMRSYVTYAYDITETVDGVDKTTTVYRTVYSDVEATSLAGTGTNV